MSGWKFNMKPMVLPRVNTKYRRIITKLPVPESLRIFTMLEKYESRSMHGQLPVIWDKTDDFLIFDPYGNRWIDFTSTIFVTNSGHGNPHIISALKRTLNQRLLHSYTFVHSSRVKFLKKLIEITPRQFEKAFLLSAGTEATECAFKLMRMYGQSINKKKKIVIAFQGCMHGRTMVAELLRGDSKHSSWIGYKDPNIYHLQIPFPWNKRVSKRNNHDWKKHFNEDIQSLMKKGLNFDNIAGFIIESYVGWAAYFYPTGYIRALCSFAKKHKSLVAFDDIQGGFGRTGKLFAYQHYGVEPDLICLGKGLSGSLPLSAVIGRRKIMDLPEIGSMSSTHSGNPLSCAAGLANLETIKSKCLISQARRKGIILHSRLQQIRKRFPDRISYVFGKGLLAAVIFRKPHTIEPDSVFASKVCERAMQRGLLLVHTGRESIKFGPPLIIPDSALLEGLDVFEESIRELEQEKFMKRM